MKTYRLRQLATSALLISLLSPLVAMAESLVDFTSRCETELEIPQNSITGFNCSSGSVLPTTQFGAACDSQALLGGPGCASNSRLGVLNFSNADVKAIWVCRKYSGYDDPANSTYHDVAMIIHNRKNGKTCFYQNNLDSTSDGPAIPGPRDATASSVWGTPQNTAGIQCTRCHTNDPFIVTPHVANALSANNLVRFNPKGAYSVVGLDFTVFNSQISRTEGCGGLCHYAPGDGSTLTNDALTKHWMVPGDLANYTPYHFKPIGGQFYLTRTNGEIWGFNGTDGGACNGSSCPHWTVLDSNSATTKIAASGSKLFQLQNTGQIWQFTGVQCSQFGACPGWQMIDNNPKTVNIVSGGGNVYQRWNTGAIWKYTGTPCSGSSCPGWQLIDNASSTIEIVASGSDLYQRHSDGTVWRYTGTPCGTTCPGWQLIANDSRTIKLVAGGTSLYMHQQSGAIWKYTGTPCNSTGCPGWQLVDFDNPSTKSVVAGHSNLYRLYTNGQIWRWDGTGQSWTMLDNNPNTTEITASTNGLLQRHTTGVVWRFTGTICSNGSCPGWTPIENFNNTSTILGARY